MLGQRVGDGLELLALGDEVGLALQLDEDAGGVVVGEEGDDGAVLGGAALALGDALLALDAEKLDGLVDVALGLVQRLLAVHHAGAGQLAELLDVGGGVVRSHDPVSLSRSLEGAVRTARPCRRHRR
ncbi:putative elongation factor Ts [Streptomyces sp. Tu6071]|nr:putative elongation factor Ts [Streptomyces sp. Tu6071]